MRDGRGWLITRTVGHWRHDERQQLHGTTEVLLQQQVMGDDIDICACAAVADRSQRCIPRGLPIYPGIRWVATQCAVNPLITDILNTTHISVCDPVLYIGSPDDEPPNINSL